LRALDCIPLEPLRISNTSIAKADQGNLLCGIRIIMAQSTEWSGRSAACGLSAMVTTARDQHGPQAAIVPWSGENYRLTDDILWCAQAGICGGTVLHWRAGGMDAARCHRDVAMVADGPSLAEFMQAFEPTVPKCGSGSRLARAIEAAGVRSHSMGRGGAAMLPLAAGRRSMPRVAISRGDDFG